MKNYDLCFIDFKNSQDEPKRDNVFYVEFPSYWETQDIFDLFSPFGAVYVGWIDDKSAFVALQNLDNVKKAAGQLIGVTGRDNRVYFYQTYVNQLSKNKNKNAVKALNETSNGNGTDKRKRESTPTPKEVMDVDGSQLNKIEEIKKEVKKIKLVDKNCNKFKKKNNQKFLF